MSVSKLLQLSAKLSHKLADELLIERTEMEVAEGLLMFCHFLTQMAVSMANVYLDDELPLKSLVEAVAPFYRKNLRQNKNE